MTLLRHLNLALLVYCVTQILVGAEAKNFSVADVGATTEIQIQNHTQDLKQILKGFSTFFVDKNIGTLSVFGRQAFSIAAGITKSSKTFHPIIACGTIGRGKLIGIADSIFLNAKFHENGESSQRTLLLNTVKWACLEKTSSKKLHIGFYGGCCKPLNDFFKYKMLKTSSIIKNNIIGFSSLVKYDVVVANHKVSPHEIPVLLEYVKNGGNLIMGQSAKRQPSPGHFGLSYPANIIASHAGFVWKNSSDKLVFDEKYRIPISTDRLQHTNLLDAWSVVKDIPKKLNATVKQAWATVDSALVSISPNDPFWEKNLSLTQALRNVLKKAIFSP